MFQRHDLQQFRALGHQRPVTLLGPAGPPRKNPVFKRHKLLLEEPPSEIGRPDRRGEKLLQIGFGDAVQLGVAHRLDGDLRRGIADISPRRKERLALAGEPHRKHLRRRCNSGPARCRGSRRRNRNCVRPRGPHIRPSGRSVAPSVPRAAGTPQGGRLYFRLNFFDKSLHALQI